jgi:hypothetical protein
MADELCPSESSFVVDESTDLVGPQTSHVPSSRDANPARRRNGARYIATLRLLGAQREALELVCPHLSKHCA